MNETPKQKKGISVLQDIFNIIGGERLVLIGAIIVVFILFSSLNSNFFSLTNIVNLLVAASLVGLVAIGHTYLIIAGQNDLSPGSLAALSGTLCALLVSWKIPLVLSILITLAVAAGVGVCNATMVNKIKLDPFIATLVSQAILRGFAYIICDGKPVAISNPAFIEIGKTRFAGIPLSVWIMLLSIGIFGFILAKTKFGRSIYAIGGNKDAARLAGLNPQRIILICFVMMGLFCGIGGIVFAARMNSGQPAANVNLEFDAITAVILGGVSFTGGVGNMGGTVLGIILIQAFNTGLIMVNVPSFWQYVARGALLLFALTTDYLRKEKRNKVLLAASMKNA
ncbi:ABC transporter permease [Caproiciproducens sp. CPB-2]|uniref:ABC transporter permease n=1 Tax=unclassified Caproiciproducens TaxID=2643836 RepID=UPI0023DA17BB|nr:ABC transporter permease [Caproiciproducens sp. CPB-2]MDF1495350.1 ABC transporter permease [Caproiciproducens sp. CPB-2]